MSQNRYQIANRYVKALFELAEEEQMLETVFRDLMNLREQLQTIPDLQPFLSQASIEWTHRQVVLDEIAQAYHPIVKQALAVIGENHRMAELSIILDECEAHYNELKGILSAQVTTVIPLTETQKEQLIQKLKIQFDGQQILLEEKIDPNILGGVVVQLGNRVLDGSIKTQLEKIKQELSH